MGDAQPLTAETLRAGALLDRPRDARYLADTSWVPWLQDGKVQCGPIAQLSPPQPDSSALAAVTAAGRTAVLWSDGTLAAYASSSLGNSSGQLQPQLCRRLRGFVLSQRAQQQQQVMTPQNGKLHRNSKKRGHGSSNGSGAAEAVSLTALGTSGLLAVVGWSSESQGACICSALCPCGLHACSRFDIAALAYASVL